MTEHEFVTRFLDINQPMEETIGRHSTLILLLRSARSLSGRNVHTGVYEGNEFTVENFTGGTYLSFQYSGLISYLIFLEQIGSIFRPSQAATIKKTAIFKALKYFGQLPEEKINAIVGLRNSVAHKFGLATEKAPKSLAPQKFTLSWERNSTIVQLPPTPWSGNFSDKSNSSSTIVYLHNLRDMIEDIFHTIVRENRNGNIILALDDGIEELKARYTIVYG